jgi:hypothetical protein
VKLTSHGSMLETYGKKEAEFSPNSQLYREIQDRKFTGADLNKFHDQRTERMDGQCGRDSCLVGPPSDGARIITISHQNSYTISKRSVKHGLFNHR